MISQMKTKFVNIHEMWCSFAKRKRKTTGNLKYTTKS